MTVASYEADMEQLKRQVETLHQAVESNRTIALAMGLEMSRRGIDAEAAFVMFREMSQRTNTRLFDVAERVVALHHVSVRAQDEAVAAEDEVAVVDVRCRSASAAVVH